MIILHSQLDTYRILDISKFRLIFIFQLIHFSYQFNHEGRLLTVMDCLKAIETGGIENLTDDGDLHAKYILNKLLMSNDTNNSSLNETADFYPYSHYRYAILNKIFTSGPESSMSVMIISSNCNSIQTQRLIVFLQNLSIFCESLNVNNFHPIKIFSSFHSLRVKKAILLLPRIFTRIYLEMTAAFHCGIFHYITIDYIPDAIRDVQLINPLLKISNLHLINSSTMFGYGLMNMMNRTECSISKEKIFFNDELDILSCQYQSNRIIRIVTIFYNNHVFPLQDYFPTQSKCEIGLPCKMRSKDGEKPWTWLCCAGMYIDRLSTIMAHLEYPFIIYIVEDGMFGSLKNGNWNGLVDDLHQGRADISVAEMSYTQERSQVMDYIHVLTESLPIAVLLRRPKAELEILNFEFVPNSTNILICFLLLLHFAVFLINYIFECIASQQNCRQKYSFKDSWSFVGAILFQRDLGGKATTRWSGRFLAVIYAFSMTVLIGSYTATLTAENVRYKDSPTFHGLRDEMFKDPKKRVGLYLGGNHERLADRYNHTSERFGVMDYEVAAKQLLEGKFDAIIGTVTDLNAALMSQKSYCKELILHVDEIESEHLSWGCRKNSKICSLFSLSILHLLESKDFESIDKKWSPVSSCTGKEPKKYPWQYAGGLVICLTIGTGVCVVLLVLETYFASLKWGKRSYKVNSFT